MIFSIRYTNSIIKTTGTHLINIDEDKIVIFAQMEHHSSYLSHVPIIQRHDYLLLDWFSAENNITTTWLSHIVT